jgi:hypothetical protein
MPYSGVMVDAEPTDDDSSILLPKTHISSGAISFILHLSTGLGIFFMYLIIIIDTKDDEMFSVAINIALIIVIFMGLSPILSSITGYIHFQRSGWEPLGIIVTFWSNLLGSLIGLILIIVILGVAVGNTGDNNSTEEFDSLTHIIACCLSNGISAVIAYLLCGLVNSPTISLLFWEYENDIDDYSLNQLGRVKQNEKKEERERIEPWFDPLQK